MVVEIAILEAKPGEADNMRKGLEAARSIISKANGYIDSKFQQGIEDPNRFVLYIQWQTVEDHTNGFRQGPLFPEWRAHWAQYMTRHTQCSALPGFCWIVLKECREEKCVHLLRKRMRFISEGIGGNQGRRLDAGISEPSAEERRAERADHGRPLGQGRLQPLRPREGHPRPLIPRLSAPGHLPGHYRRSGRLSSVFVMSSPSSNYPTADASKAR